MVVRGCSGHRDGRTGKTTTAEPLSPMARGRVLPQHTQTMSEPFSTLASATSPVVFFLTTELVAPRRARKEKRKSVGMREGKREIKTEVQEA